MGRTLFIQWLCIEISRDMLNKKILPGVLRFFSNRNPCARRLKQILLLSSRGFIVLAAKMSGLSVEMLSSIVSQ